MEIISTDVATSYMFRRPRSMFELVAVPTFILGILRERLILLVAIEKLKYEERINQAHTN